MRRLVVFFLAVLVAGLPARAEEPADAIQAVIADQLRAFEASDLDVAYAHASPSIQSKFRTPEIFGQMVATGYPVIWRPAGYEMLDLLDSATGPVQIVLLQDAQGRFYHAAYEMRLIGDTWRIDGVSLRQSGAVGS